MTVRDLLEALRDAANIQGDTLLRSRVRVEAPDVLEIVEVWFDAETSEVVITVEESKDAEN
jgi:hypothetical protein